MLRPESSFKVLEPVAEDGAQAREYEELLPRLRKKAARLQAESWQTPVWLLLLQLLIFTGWQYWRTSSGAEGGSIMAGILLTVISLGIVFIAYMAFSKLPMTAGIAEQLETSGLARRLAGGLFDQDSIFEHCHPFMRPLLPRGPLGERWPVLRRIAQNLDWYLGPPRRFTPDFWQTLFGFAPLILLGLGGLLLPALFGAPEILLSYLPVFLVGALGMAMLATAMANLRHSQNCRLLADYLGRELHGIAEERAAKLAGQPLAVSQAAYYNDSGAPPGTTNMLLVINQLEQDLKPAAGGGMAFTGLGYLMPLLGINLTVLSPANAHIHLLPLFMLTLIPLACVPALVTGRFKKRYALRIRERLQQSSLAQQIASGDLREDAVLEATPPMLRALASKPDIPKGYAGDLRRVLWRVAFNLEWYLNPRSPHLRPVWVLQGIVSLVYIGMLLVPIFGLISTAQQLPIPQAPWGLPLAAPPSLLELLRAHWPLVSAWIGGGLALSTLFSLEG